MKTADLAFPVECKAAAIIKGTHLKGIIDYLSNYDIKTGFIISLDRFKEIRISGDKKIINVPLYMAEAIEEIVKIYALS